MATPPISSDDFWKKGAAYLRVFTVLLLMAKGLFSIIVLSTSCKY